MYLVGAGPGHEELITLRGKECIEKADVVIYDNLCNPQMLSWARRGAELILAGRPGQDHAARQKEINDLLREHASAGRTVCRLKGGDPVIFGRGGEEAQELRRADIAFEIVPGISSAIAGPVYAGIPLTHRDHSSQVTIFTGHEDPTKAEARLDFRQIAQAGGTKVMLMGVERIRPIADALRREGMDPQTPVALVRWATTGRQETVASSLAGIADAVEKAGLASPAVAIFGDVVKLRDELNWFEELPLTGKRVVVTRARKQAGALSKRLRELGADVIELPTIRIEPPRDLMAFGRLVQDSHSYDWVIFTSPNGVEAFFDLFFKLYEDVRSIGGARIAAIGAGTASRIREYRLGVDLVAETPVAEGLLEAFEEKAGTIENLRVLWVRAEETRDVLSKGLVTKGAILDEAIAYRTVAETEDPFGAVRRFRDEGADILTFTSSSSVEHFLALKLRLPKRLKIASIGPITTRTLAKHGLAADAEAEPHDLAGLVAAVRKLAE